MMGLQMKAKLRGVLEEQMNKQYADRLDRAKRHISYEEWLRLVKENGDEREYPYEPGILGHGQGASEAAAGEEISQWLAEHCDDALTQGLAMLREQGIWLILQKNGYMDPAAYSLIADHFKEHPETLMLYGDEDALDVTGKHRCSPFFKPEWSPDTWLSSFYLGSVVALRRELAEKLPSEIWPQNSDGVVFFEEISQVRLLVQRLLELAGGFEQGCDTIVHLPGMLFHMNYDGAQATVQREYRGGNQMEGPGQQRQTRSISVIIPSKDNPKVLGQCLDSLQKCQEEMRRADGGMDDEGGKEFRPLEILVVDNGSSAGNKIGRAHV